MLQRPSTAFALADAPAGQPLHVVGLRPPAAGAAAVWPQQLAELGFTPGERAMVMRRGWPGADPLAVRVGGSTFALRKAEADCVMVQASPTDAAPNACATAGQ
jgi:ferrous iron transport protein A